MALVSGKSENYPLGGFNIFTLVFMAVAAILLFQPAGAYELTDCSAVNVSGSYNLTQDIASSPSQRCLDISAKNVVLNCQGHSIAGRDMLDSVGIYARNDNIVITNCTITDWYTGIKKEGSNYGEISWSDIYSNARGITFANSENNQLFSSKVHDNSVGVYISFSEHNWLFNNLFKNTNNTLFTGSNQNDWNTTKQKGTRTYSSGSYIGGNYWSVPTTTGYSDLCIDLNSDGFCDNAYTLDTTNVDHSPLSNKYIPDSTPPSVRIDSPASGQIVNSTNITISVWADDAVYWYTNVSIWQGGTYLKSESSYTKGSFSVSLKVNSGGYYNITATAYDYDGNSRNVTVMNVLTPLEMTSCGDLSVNGEKYMLIGDVAHSGGSICMNILADNILFDCQGKRIIGREMSYKTYGINLNNRKNITITNCVISDWSYGIFSQSSSENIITQSIVTKNRNAGIYLYSSSNNLIKENVIGNNSGYGMQIYSSADNKIYNNVFDNNWNVFFEGTRLKNYWNTDIKQGTRIYANGPEIGGNFWSGMNEFSRTCLDKDQNGFCDNTYDVETLTNNPPATGSFIEVMGSLTGRFLDGITALLIQSTSNNIDSLPLSDEYVKDMIPPITNATITLPDGKVLNTSSSGWVNADYVKASLVCSDGYGSGCKKTLYCFSTSSNCTPEKTYSGAFNISFDRNKTEITYLNFFSMDKEDNYEVMTSVAIRSMSRTQKEFISYPLDSSYLRSRTFNVTVKVVRPEEHNFTEILVSNSTGDRILSLNVSANSSAGGTIFKNVSVPDDGTYSIRVIFHSIYGFVTDESIVSVNIDSTPPEILLFEPPSSPIYVGGQITVICSVMDNIKGSFEGNVSGIRTDATGMYTATCTATDDAGNNASKTFNYNVMEYICNDGDKRCEENNIQICVNNRWQLNETCGWSCLPSGGYPQCISQPDEEPKNETPGEEPDEPENETGGGGEGLDPTIISIGALLVLVILVVLVIGYMKLFKKPNNDFVKNMAIIEAKIREADMRGNDVTNLKSEFELAQADINMGLTEMARPRINKIEKALKKMK